MSGIHDNHRERLRTQYAENGEGSLSEERLLELILFTPIPRKDTYAIAKRLLKRFGNMRGVLEANINDLRTVEDVGFSTALYLKAIYDAAHNYILPHIKPPKRFKHEREMMSFIVDMFEGSVVEKVAVLCFNKDFMLLHQGILQEGNVAAASFKMRRLTEIAIKTNASYVILAHNHPRGSDMPSSEDLDSTRRIASSLATNGIVLWDHLIVHGKETTSILRILGYNKDFDLPWNE